MGNGQYCNCRCITSDFLVDDQPSHSSWIRNKDGLTEKRKSGAEESSLGDQTSTTAAGGSKLDEDDYSSSDSENSAGGFTPKRILPNSSGKVSPVPKLVLPKQVFRDNGFKSQGAQQRSGGGRASGLTTKDWAADQAQFAHLSSLPAGWIRVRSRTTGSIYYCFTATGETTFEEPKGTGPPAAQGNGDSAGGGNSQPQDSPLPPGWHRMVSRSTGRTYYWNSRLNQAQFEHPLDSNSTACPEGTVDANSDLPPGWVKLISRTTGRPYFFNEKLHFSQFEHPSEGVQYPNGTNPDGSSSPPKDAHKDKDKQAETPAAK